MLHVFNMATRARQLGGEVEDDDPSPAGEVAQQQGSRRWNLLSTVAIFGGIIAVLRIGSLLSYFLCG